MLNRSSLLVRPKQPYLDWAAQLDDSGIVPAPDGEQTVYLIPEYDSEDQALEILKECFDVIFDCELHGWHTQEAAWPGERNFAMFQEWFSVEFNSVVEDLCDFELVDDVDSA